MLRSFKSSRSTCSSSSLKVKVLARCRVHVSGDFSRASLEAQRTRAAPHSFSSTFDMWSEESDGSSVDEFASENDYESTEEIELVSILVLHSICELTRYVSVGRRGLRSLVTAQ